MLGTGARSMPLGCCVRPCPGAFHLSLQQRVGTMHCHRRKLRHKSGLPFARRRPQPHGRVGAVSSAAAMAAPSERLFARYYPCLEIYRTVVAGCRDDLAT